VLWDSILPGCASIGSLKTQSCSNLFCFSFQSCNQQLETSAKSGTNADALVEPKMQADTIGPCRRHPEATEIAFYVIITALVCFVVSASFPLVMSCVGAVQRRMAKKVSTVAKRDVTPPSVELRSFTQRPRFYDLAAAAAAAGFKENENVVIDVHEEDGGQTEAKKEDQAPLATEEVDLISAADGDERGDEEKEKEKKEKD
jgi:hypothetical protein